MFPNSSLKLPKVKTTAYEAEKRFLGESCETNCQKYNMNHCFKDLSNTVSRRISSMEIADFVGHLFRGWSFYATGIELTISLMITILSCITNNK